MKSEEIRLQLNEDYWLSKIFDFAQAPHVFYQSTAQLEHKLQLPEGDLCIDKLAKGNVSGKFCIYLSLYSIVLQKLFYLDDALIAIPPRESNEHLDMGPVFFHANGSGTLKEYIKRSQVELTKCFQHQEYRTTKVKDRLETKAEALESSKCFGISFEGLGLVSEYVETAGITMYVHQQSEKTATFKSNGQYCDDAKLRSIAEAFNGLAKNIDTLLETPIKDIDLSFGVPQATSERDSAILNTANNSQLQDLFERQVVKTPDSIAITSKNGQWTYREISNYADGLAQYLEIEKNVQPGDRVMLLMERSEKAIIALLATLKVGAVYVPVDPDYPQAFIDVILKDVDPICVIGEAMAGKQEESSIEPIFIELNNQLLDSLVTQKYTARVSNAADAIAYIIYTSGSTGKPKGVMISHAAVINYLLGLMTKHELIGNLDFVLTSSITFDASLRQLFVPLLNGGAVHIPAQVKDPESIVHCFLKNNVTIFSGTPSFCKMLMEDDAFEELAPKLSYILLGAEPLDGMLTKQLANVAPQAQLINLYGPTEITVNALTYAIPSGSDENPPIGTPLPNYEVYILDQQGNQLPIGAEGEICIGGIGLAKGYLNLPESTAEKFVDWRNKRLYRTGDWGRLLSDGNIQFLGRLDTQVKIRGYRIECSYVEQTLCQAGAREAVVVAAGQEEESTYLAAYITGISPDTLEELKKKIKVLLPDFMIPSAYMLVDKFSLKSSGKIDRNHLPDFDAGISSNAELPETDLQKNLLQLWLEILPTRTIGLDDNFFQIGGHSISATKLLTQIHRRINRSIALVDIFRNTTIRKQADFITQNTEKKPISRLEANERPNQIPLSYSQERLWFIDQLEGSLHYHIPYACHLKGSVDEQKLTTSLKTLVDRHEILRSTITEQDGVPFQVVQTTDLWQIEVLSISDKTHNDPKELVREAIEKPFDLSHDLPFRAKLIRLPEGEYVLFLMIHHIAGDGWSVDIFLNELHNIYDSLIQERPLKLETLDVQYADYAVWQRKNITADYLSKGLSYWQEKLQGVSPLNLPTDFVRPPVSKTHAGVVTKELSDLVLTKLVKLSGEEECTLFMTLMTAFNVLLHRYTGQEDVCIGSPIAGRHQAEVEGLIGFFVNTLAFRFQVNATDRFVDVLHKCREVSLGAFEHQDTPFEKVVESLDIDRDRSRNPIFQVMFLLENLDVKKELQLGDLDVQPLELEETITEKFDLTLSCTKNEKGLSLSISYRKDLYNEDTVTRMLGHYENVLKAIVEDREISINTIELLRKSEVQQLLNTFNTDIIPDQPQHNLVNLFAEQASLNAEKTALVFEGEQMTYRELDERSNQLSHYLGERGIGQEELVGICLERGFEMVIGLFGILKTGGAYVPIDPDYPVERIRYILDDIESSIVLTTASSVEKLAGINNTELVSLDTSWETIAQYPSHPCAAVIESNQLAYVMYTSGSTGKPKGVMIEHGSIVNKLLWTQDYYKLSGASDVAIQKTSFCFDASIWEFFWPLMVGMKVVVAKPDGHRDPYYLSQLIDQEKITIIHFVPSMLEAFLSMEETTKSSSSLLTSLKHIICGGEALKLDHILKIRNLLPDVAIHNSYGPTEASVGVSNWDVPLDVSEIKRVVIGSPVLNTRLHVLDSFQNLVPVGIEGELYIEGTQLARGYLNKETLNTEYFASIHIPNQGMTRLYRTGDIVKWHSEGNLEYIGRNDDQVKIRGYRVELGEIESLLLESNMVDQAVVLAVESQDHIKSLVGYVVLKVEYTQDDVNRFLGANLPAYMVPQRWISLDELPLTSNGKVDKKNLPAPNFVQGNSYEPATNPTEETLVGVWEHLLKIDQPGIHSNFFESGGHSLLAARLASSIRKHFGQDIRVKDIFEYPTISSLSSKILESNSGIKLPSLERLDRPSQIPLSYSQERLWFIDQLEGSTHYHIPHVSRLSGPLDIVKLSSSLRAIIDRHEILRTVIDEEDGFAFQVVQSSDLWDLEIYDQSSIISSGNSLDSFISKELSRPFSLKSDSMLRAVLIKVSDEEHILILVLHHISGDGWSVGVFLEELSNQYQSEDVAFDLSPLGVQYADYSIWQRTHISGDHLTTRLSYWKRQLSGVSPLNLTTDYARSSTPGIRGGIMEKIVPKPVHKGLLKVSLEEGTTLFMTLLAAFKVLLYRHTGQEDICLGSPVAGRHHEELEGLIGFFVNTLAFRDHLSGSDSYLDVLHKVRSTSLEAFEHQDAPFEGVVEALELERDLSRNPIFDVLFVVQNNSGQKALLLDGVKAVPLEFTEVHTEKFDMTVMAVESSEGLHISISYRKDLYKAETIGRMLGHYENILSSIVENKAVGIKEIKLLTEVEEDCLLNTFNHSLPDPEKYKSIVKQFEGQVDLTPDAIALLSGEELITFQELDEQSNQLSHCLQSHGVSSEHIVGVCLDRCTDLIVSILGILKSGGAYLPIDPQYPKERIDYLLTDSQLSIVLTNENGAKNLRPTAKVTAIYVDSDSDTITDFPTTRLGSTLLAEQLAYVIYTSGSTGYPKGVMIEHGNVASFIDWCHEEFSNESFEVLYATTSVCFDLSVFELWYPLTTGKKIRLLEDGTVIAAQLEQDTAVFINTVPSVVHLLLQQEISWDRISVLNMAGEPIPLSIQSDLPMDHLSVRNLYGPSETTTYSTCYHLDKHSPILIGQPIGNAQLRLLDEHGNLVPIGVSGEVHIGGSGVARGYLNQKELTDSKFVQSWNNTDVRWYKTGDIGQWQSDGSLKYLGRSDDQVKVRGYRIELGEIERALFSSGLIDQATVLAYDGKGGKDLAGYLVGNDQYGQDELLNYLTDCLPAYMIPSQWIELESLPLNSNGKVDKKALSLHSASQQERENVYAPPGNDTEETLVVIWQQLLGVEQVSVHDNFFQLGGHSLLVARMIAAIRKQFDVEISIRDVFSHPTVFSLSTFLLTLNQGLLVSPIKKEGRPQRIPLSQSQERLWFIDQLQGSKHYHISYAGRLTGDLDSEKLEASLGYIVDRHEVLRTVILEEHGEPYQVVKPTGTWQLDTQEMATPLEEGVLGEFIVGEMTRPFDLSKDLPIRATLLKADQHFTLLLIVHHIAGDGWSIDIFLRELSYFYTRLLTQQKIDLPSLNVQYADFAIWQRKNITDNHLAPHLTYWGQQLADVTTLNLPTDFARSSKGKSEGALVIRNLNGSVLDGLRGLSLQEESTLFMTLTAAFKVVLYRYTGQNDICIGSPIAGRQHAEVEDLIGFFVNTLAFRNQINGSDDFIEVLRKVKQTTLEAFEHQDAPFEKIVEDLGVERDGSRNPIFQVAFAMGNSDGEHELSLEGVTVEDLDLNENRTERFDFTVLATEIPEGLSLSINYRKDLYKNETIEHMLCHFERVLLAVAKEPAVLVSDIGLLGEEEIAQLEQWSGTKETFYPKEKLVHELFEIKAKLFPDSQAIFCEGRTVSYEELNRRSNQVAVFLRHRSIEEGDLVVLAMGRNEWFFISMLGVLKAGATYVPVLADFPSERLNFILEDTAAKILLSDKSVSDQLTVDYELIEESAHCDVSEFIPIHLSSDSPAYVMYTSGSTGQPKGVIVPHRGIVRLVLNTNYVDILPEDRLLQLSNPAFDGSVFDVYGALLNGACVCIPNHEEILSYERLHAFVQRHSISITFMTTALLNVLVDDMPEIITHFRKLYFGGEAHSLDHIRRALPYLNSSDSLVHVYGPTEGTTFSTFHIVQSSDVDSNIIPIGRPIAHSSLYILDTDLNLLPAGAIGELCIGGDGLALGYLNRTELNEDRFVNHPLLASERLYRTGDLGYWDRQGAVVFKGRKDDQVKIRGYRIELGEIENVLLSTKIISQVVVVAREKAIGNKQLVCYLVVLNGYTVEDAKAYLETQVPSYMIPSQWIELEKLPLNKNGKIDKQCLPAPTFIRETSHHPPSNATERKLLEIWQRLLKLEDLGVNDNFFESGGHSLLAARLASSIRRHFDCDIRVKDIFECPTISSLSSVIVEGDTGTKLPSLERFDRPSKIPLSYSQERLWFIDQLEGSTHYHIPYVSRITGSLDIGKLSTSFQAIIDRHETLRTVIGEEEGIAYQIVHSSDFWELDIHKESSIIASGKTIEAFISEEISRPFSLVSECMLRAVLIKISEEEHILILVLHHISGDGWSVGVFLEELSNHYGSRGKLSNLPTLSVQYADYSIWERKYISGEHLESRLLYWKTKLSDVSPLNLTTDYSRPSTPGINGGVVKKTISNPLMEGLLKLSQEEETTLFMTLLAAFKVLLYRYTGQEDICVGSPVAGRHHEEIERLIGFFVNTLAFRDKLDNSDSYLDVLQKVRETTLAAFEHEDAPFEGVVEALELNRDLSRNPIFDVMFVVQNNIGQKELILDGLEVSPVDFPEGHAEKFDMTVSAVESSEGLRLSISYRTDLYKAQTMSRMLGDYEKMLLAIVENRAIGISEVNLLSESEEFTLLNVFNHQLPVYGEHTSLVEQFECQVDKTPDEIALLFDKEALTFRELDERSNQLSHYLQSKGVIDEFIVGVCLDRCPDLIISIIAVLKSGGAYLPIDTKYAEERINYLLKDSQLSLVLTNTAGAENLNPQGNVTTIFVNNDWPIINEYPKTKLGINLLPGQLAYVIYTAGSTGQPKGVMIEHGNISSFIDWSKEEFFSESFDVLYATTSVCVDLSVFEMWYPLTTGKKLRLLEDGAAIPYYLVEDGSVYINTVPSVVDLLLRQEMSWGNVSVLNMGGEPIPLSTQRDLPLEHMSVRNLYGLTETTIYSTSYKLGKDSPILIGKPTSNAQVRLLDQHGNMVPIGVTGEVHIGGIGVARGYLNKKELTDSKFVQDIHNPNGIRWYKTGDMAQWLSDGNLKFLGRSDDQVLIRGYRIELSEIESALLASGLVEQTVVLTFDQKGSKDLIGYLVVNDKYDQEELLAYLGEHLPSYMIPNQWMKLESLPLNSNGKVDKEALPAPSKNQQHQNNAYVAPVNDGEKRLAVIWQHLLQVDRIGVHDDFFQLGGHSLLVARMISAIRKEFDVEISIKEIFNHPTIKQQQQLITAPKVEGTLPAIEKQEYNENLPLSFGQERLWFIDKLQGSVQYHIPYSCRLHGPLDIEGFEESLKCIVQRHEILRTVIKQNDGVPYQSIISGEYWALKTLEASEITSQGKTLEDFIEEETVRPFVMDRDEMFRATLIRQSSHEHILVLVLHHIAGDGWSIGVFQKELSVLYRTQDKKNALAPLPIQYADYAIWQHRNVTGEMLSSGLNYWKAQLEDITSLNLPTDFERPALPGISGGTVSKTFNKSILEGLLDISKEAGTTLFMTLMAALKIQLYRYTGEEEICIGSPVAGRYHAESEGLIGLFVNTVAFRSRLNSTDCIDDVLDKVKSTTLEAFEHQHVPFEKVVEAIGGDRDVRRNPIFDILFTVRRKGQQSSLDLQDINISSIEGIGGQTGKIDLTVEALESDEGLQIIIGYKKELYRHDTIQNWLGHFENVLTSFVEKQDKLIGDIALLGKEETHEILNVFNEPNIDYKLEKSIVNCFEEQTDQTPEKIALVVNDKKITYAELDRRSNQLCAYLIEKDIEPEQIVAIFLDKSPELMISILATMKAGAAYLLIDPSWPEDRIAHMLQDSAATMILTSNLIAAKLSSQDALVITLETKWIEVHQYSMERNAMKPEANQAAYLIYTSGSTGKPKGVIVEHKNVVSLVYDIDYLKLETDSILLSVASISFDTTIFEYWSILLNGGTLILPHVAGLLDNYLLQQIICNNEVNSMFFPASYFNQIVDTDAHTLEGLKTVFVGGEKISERHVQIFKQKCPDANIYNSYGSAENSMISTIHLITNQDLSGEFPIGGPIDHRSIYILDHEDQLAPVGFDGEICVGGAGVARGYLNHETLNKEKFIDSPLIGGGKLYRTGDIGHWKTDGTIVFIGRKDNQIKIRGHRIELGEIESKMLDSSMVDQVVVTAVEGGPGDNQLVAYLVPSKSYESNNLKTYLMGCLPNYMIPWQFVVLTELPMTINGKVDIEKLPTPESRSSVVYTPPRSETEKNVAQIWRELLDVDQIGVNDNFFELGGHSLLVMRMSSFLLKRLGVHLEVKDIFINAELGILSKVIDESDQTDYMPIPANNGNLHHPLSPSQKRLWLIDQMGDQSQAYNIPMKMRLGGSVDVERLQKAIRLVIGKHESLRTVFRLIKGEPRQFVLPKEDPIFETKLIYVTALEDVNESINIKTLSESAYSFDLSNGPLITSSIVVLRKDELVLFINMHHIICDKWSLDVIWKDLNEFYKEIESNEAFVPTELSVQFKDYCYWLMAQEDDNKSGKDFWANQFKDGIPQLELHPDHPYSDTLSSHGSSYSFSFDCETSQQISEIASGEKISLFSTLLGLVKILLFRYTNQSDILIGTPVSGRNHPDLEDQVGFFLNTILIRTKLDDNQSFEESLRSVSRNAVNAMSHKDYPYDLLVEDLSSKEDANSDLFKVLMSFVQPSTTDETHDSEVTIESMESKNLTSKFEMSFLFSQGAKSINCTIEYRDIFEEDTILYLATGLQNLVKFAVENAGKPIEQFDLIETPAESKVSEIGFDFT